MGQGIVGKIWSINDGSHGRTGGEQISDSIAYINNEYKCSKHINVSSFYQIGRELHYVENSLKTMEGLYIGARRISDLKNAADEMMQVKRYFDKADKRVALHGVISLPVEESDEKNAPKLMMLMDEVLKEVFPNNQAVYALHTNTDNLHCHFVVNTVGLDGKKIHMGKNFMRDVFHPALNRAALKYGFSENELWKKKFKKDEMDFVQRKMMLRDLLDQAIEQADSVEELVENLRSEGVTVNIGKYMSIKTPHMPKAVRSQALGSEYTLKRINERIMSKYDAFKLLAAGDYAKDVSFVKNRYPMSFLKKYKDMSDDEKKEVVKLLKEGKNPWMIRSFDNWQMKRMSENLTRVLFVKEIVDGYGDGDVLKAKEKMIENQKEISRNIKEIRENLKQYKPQIDIYKRMLDLSKSAYLYEATGESEYQTAFLEYQKLERRLKVGYHKNIYDVDVFYHEQMDGLSILKAQRSELKKQYKMLAQYENELLQVENMSLLDAIGFSKALEDTKRNIFATSEKYIVSKDVAYSLHVVTTPAMINGKRSIKTEIEIVDSDGEVIDSISSESTTRKEFNECVFAIEKDYGFREFEIADSLKDVKVKMESKKM